MTKPETPGYRFVAALLGVDAGEQPDHRSGWWREFWIAMSGRAGAVDDLARFQPTPDQAAALESRWRDESEGVDRLWHALVQSRTRAASEQPAVTKSQAPKPWRDRLASWRHDLAERRYTRQSERIRQVVYARRAAYIRKIIAERGLIQVDYSLSSGRIVHIPQVVGMTDTTVDIHLLPGQTPEEFERQAPAIAYNLNVAEVRVVPLAHLLIRLKLLGQLDVLTRRADARPPNGG